MYNQIFYCHKDKRVVDRLLVFGGAVYRQRGGWRWLLGKKKELVALAKLMEAEEIPPNRNEVRLFVMRMNRIGKR